MDNNVYKQLTEQRKKADRDIAERSLLKIWSYFNSLKNIDKTNLLKNIQRGQALYFAPVREINGSRLVNIPKKGEVYIDEKFMQENPKIATFQITHECLHGVSLIRDGEQVVFGHSSAKGGSNTNKYNGVLEACTQMFAEDAEGKRLPENVDYLYYVKNIMRAIKVIFGEEKLADQFLGNNINFEVGFNAFSQYKFEDFNTAMSNIYLLERKKERGILSEDETQLLENYKLSLNKSVAELIRLKSKEKKDVFNDIVNEIQDESIYNQLNPNLVTNRTNITINEDTTKMQQEKSIRDFVLKFVECYKQLETENQYNKRIAREESDIELVVEYFEQLKTGKIENVFFGGIQPEETDKNGIDFSQDNIDRMFRLLNAANNITIGSQRYNNDFCLSPEIKELLEQMQQSPKVQEMMKVAEMEIKQGKPSRASLREDTPAEKRKKLARTAFQKMKQDYNNADEYIIASVIDKHHLNAGYDSKEELALASIGYIHKGIKTKPKKIGKKYKLDIVEQTQELNKKSDKTKTQNKWLFRIYQNARIRQEEVDNSYQILQRTKQNQEQQQNKNSNNRSI